MLGMDNILNRFSTD